MLSLTALIASLFAATSVSVVEPVDGETYDVEWLPFRVIVENENELPDSVHYTLNGAPVIQVPRLNTDWPTYMQNNQRNGYSDSPAPHTSDILWTAAICGDYHEFPTPAVVDGTVYYPQDGVGTGDTLYALDAATGNVKWTYPVGYTDDTVTIWNGLLYSASDSLFCLDAETGDRVWAWGDDQSDFLQTGSPLVEDGIVYFATSRDYDSSHVFAADAISGEIIWQTNFRGAFQTSLSYHDGRLFLALYTGLLEKAPNESLFAINVDSGSTIWSNDLTEGGYWDTSPCISDGIIYIGGDDGNLHAFTEDNGTLVWEDQLHTYSYYWGVEPTPAIHDSLVFIGCCFYSWPHGYVGAYSTQSCAEVWSIVDQIEMHGSFGLAEDLAFIGAFTDDSIYAIDQTTGLVEWSFGFEGVKFDGCQSSPSITDGVMYIPATDGNLYAFGTGLKYTYFDDLLAAVGSNELIVTSWDEGSAVAADTINFTVTQTGITLESFGRMCLSAEPNPFCGSTSISFELAESGAVSLQVFDLSGRLVADLGDPHGVQGENTVHWNGCGDNGQPLSSGLYLCRIESGGLEETTGLCVLR